jgi:hypothetical protein
VARSRFAERLRKPVEESTYTGPALDGRVSREWFRGDDQVRELGVSVAVELDSRQAPVEDAGNL